ncbi:GDP-fucose protein O-fucosyltransferase 1 isoform X2 [Lingula anatina]|uniref:GDP-fucose protein O-fucosyltransferase 1 n=1 Tax=Lingula anatina TaxID=7574 RepID=A0A1S3I8Q9_LINAN|nr:GDP-fucose protein O-fucosyltransferase 1 isoform X2 [Lingula anatina]|eukprot:XP_013394637.1 GDP-fucose protein O-fucosyltransferase 1 isoform X2 [Lingula anatina]
MAAPSEAKASGDADRPSSSNLYKEPSESFIWDANGYIIFCPCMGRFGNQADHYLGALGFAKALDRTLVLPPWRTYKNVPFNDWFKVEPVKEYHRVILAEDFMQHLAPEHWPPGQRFGWCWQAPSVKDKKCGMKQGNPFGPFWDGLNVDFDDYVFYDLTYEESYIDKWKSMYPPDKYPVMAFKGAPARFPVAQRHVKLHKYFQWSEAIEKEAQDYISKTFQGDSFIGIHLRNNVDWERACEHADGLPTYMASPQCLGYSGADRKVTVKMCFPPKEEILRLTKNILIKTRAKHIYVATDKNPMIKEIEDHLKPQKVKVHHLDPWLPQIDLAILGQADHTILNCISSFSAFVKRERDISDKPSSFWGFS